MPRRTRLGPDFLGIGAPKTGTSWLFHNLRRHPEVWLPPPKEIHWFDEVQAGGPYSLRERLVGRDPAAARWRRWTRTQVKSQLVARAFVEPGWKLRYLLRRRDDADYLRLFERAGDRVAGEITPAYCDLDDAMVARVASLVPAAKIVFLMRNPIERSWSEVRRLLGRQRKRPVEDIPHDEIVAFLHGPESLDRSDYVTILHRWRRRFPAVYGGYLEHIATDPGGALRDVLEFLGVDPGFVPPTVGRAENVGWGSAEVPPRYRRLLAELLAGPIRRAADELGGPALDWLEYAEASR